MVPSCRATLVASACSILVGGLLATVPAHAANLLTNPDFDTSLAGWTPSNSNQVWSSLDADGEPTSGSARTVVVSDTMAPFIGTVLRQCVPVNAGEGYEAGIRALVPSGQERTGVAIAALYFYANESCAPAGILDTHTLGAVDTEGAWEEVSDTLTAPAGAASANLFLSLRKDQVGGELVGHFDDAYVCPPGDCEASDEALTGEWFTDPQYPDFRFRAEITAGAQTFEGARENSCLRDTVCVSGAVPGRSEVFVRILGPRPNGYLWPTLVRFTPSQVRIEIEQISTGATKLYTLPAVPPGGDPSAVQDRTGFEPSEPPAGPREPKLLRPQPCPAPTRPRPAGWWSGTGFEKHRIVDGDPAWLHGRSVDAETTLTVAGDRAEDRRVAFHRPGIDRDDHAPTVALVDPHAQAADAQHGAYPAVLGERRRTRRFDQEIRPETLDVELRPDPLAEPGDRLGRDEG